MKTLLTIILIITSFTVLSQDINIGDSYEDVMNTLHPDSIEEYIGFQGFYQIIYKDYEKTMRISLDLKHDNVIGISYLYPEGDNQSEKLSGHLSGFILIDVNTWVKGDILIFEMKNAIIKRDVQHINKMVLYSRAED